jgi:hypothetical protein
VKFRLGDAPTAPVDVMIVEYVKMMEDAFIPSFTHVPPPPRAPTVNGRFVHMFDPAPTAIDVAPLEEPVTVTCRPILVYVPEEVNAPTTVSPPPWFGVQVPSS